MTAGLQPALWHDLFGTFATVCAALLGLYFVAISLHLRELQERPLLLYRSRTGLRGLLLGLVLSLAVLIPGQTIGFLGVELITVLLAYVAIISPTVGSEYRAPKPDKAAARVIAVASLTAIALVIIGGGSLIIGKGPGLYLLVPAVLFTILVASYFAWHVLLAAGPRRSDDE